MTAFDDLYSASLPTLQHWHGKTVIRWPRGSEGAAETVADCLWTPDEDAAREGGQDGVRYVLGGELEVPAAQTIHESDVWKIDDVLYATVGLGAVHGGMRVVLLRNVEKITTSRHTGGRL